MPDDDIENARITERIERRLAEQLPARLEATKKEWDKLKRHADHGKTKRVALCLANLDRENDQYVHSQPMPRLKAEQIERTLTEVGIDVLVVDWEEDAVE